MARFALLSAAIAWFGIAFVGTKTASGVSDLGGVPTISTVLNAAQLRAVNVIDVSYTSTQHSNGKPGLPLFKYTKNLDFTSEYRILSDLKNGQFAIDRAVFPSTDSQEMRRVAQFQFFWDGKGYVRYRPGLHTAQTATTVGEDAKDELASSVLLRIAFVLPPSPNGTGLDDGSLISVLRNGALRRALEDVDGRRCCVVDVFSHDGTPISTVWLDVERGFAPLKVQSYDGSTKEIGAQWRLSDYALLSGGGQHLWFPMMVDTTAKYNAQVVTNHIVVGKAQINPPVTAASFRFTIPRGTFVHDAGTNRSFIVGGVLNLGNGSEKSLAPPPGWNWMLWGNIGVVALVIALLMFRTARRRRATA